MKYRAIFRIYGLIIANMLLLMGGQLAYLYLVGPMSMEDGRALDLPDIPLLGFLTTVLMVAGALIMAAILQKKPLPMRYVSVSKEPHRRNHSENIDENEKVHSRNSTQSDFCRACP